MALAAQVERLVVHNVIQGAPDFAGTLQSVGKLVVREDSPGALQGAVHAARNAHRQPLHTARKRSLVFRFHQQT